MLASGRLRLEGTDDTRTFSDGDDLVGLHVWEVFELLGRRPLDLYHVGELVLAETEVQP